jgi:integrase
MRPRKIKVRRYTDSNRPHLKFVVNYRESGKRKRSFFETEAQAKSFAAFKNAELQKNGREHAEFPTAIRVMAQNAVEALKPFPGKNIMDAVKHYVAHLKASEKSCTAIQLVKELLAAKKADGVSERHLGDLRYRLSVFANAFDGKPVATITAPEIDDWLRSLPVSPLTRNNYRQRTALAFNFAMRRGYATSNPAEGAAKAKVVSEPPGILSVNEAARLLEAAAPNVLPYIAIGLFAGLRAAELERLDWSEIDFESDLIKVTAAKSKTAQRRFVKMQPNLREWLLPHRKHKGNVRPQNRFEFRRSFNQARKAAGIKQWPDNALRHSFASYHMAHFNDAALTALQLGHRDSRVTIAHYRELVKPKDAERYWQLQPARTQKIVPLVAR